MVRGDQLVSLFWSVGSEKRKDSKWLHRVRITTQTLWRLRTCRSDRATRTAIATHYSTAESANSLPGPIESALHRTPQHLRGQAWQMRETSEKKSRIATKQKDCTLQ